VPPEAGRPLGPWAALYERLYARLHGLHDLPGGDRSCVRFAVTRHRGPAVRLADGTVVARGDRVVVLHLHNASLGGLGQDGLSAAQAGLAFRRLLRESLALLATRAVTDPRFADLRAVGGLTYRWRGSRRFGFAASPPRSRAWARVVAAHQQRLTRRHGAPSRVEARSRAADGRREARWIWLSRAELVARYGVAATGTGGPGTPAFGVSPGADPRRRTPTPVR
jgi:hypothetical protein